MNGSKLAAFFLSLAACLGTARGAAPLPMAGEQKLITRGELVADLRPDVAPGATVWTNHAAGPKSVGDLARVDGRTLAVEGVDGPSGKLAAVAFDKNLDGVLLSAKPVPPEMTGAGSASVEAWVNVPALDVDATVVAYGPRQRGKQRQFLYGSRKPLSGFFADVGDWGDFTPDAGKWRHVAWVYEGERKTMTVYVDGQSVVSKPVELDTLASPLAVGAGNDEQDRDAYTFDPIRGLIASVRGMTGVLSAADVKQNFDAGPGSTPGAATAASKAVAGASPTRPAATGASASAAAPRVTFTGVAEAPAGRMTLWYRWPAGRWIDALAIGNGRLGGMVFGGVAQERIGLNEDTLWSGGPYEPAVRATPEQLKEIQRLMFAGENRAAQNLADKVLQGNPRSQVSYQTVGEIRFTFPGHETAADYRRQLDIDSAVAAVTYTTNGVTFTREYFASPVDQVIVVRLTADKPGQITFDARFTSPLEAKVEAVSPDTIKMTGRNGDKLGRDKQVEMKGAGNMHGASKSRLDLIRANLSPAAVTITTLDADGGPGYTIRRPPGQPPLLTGVDGRVVPDVDLERGTFLPLDAYSSAEIEDIAKETMGERRRALLDELRAGDLHQIRLAVAQNRRQLEANADAIRATRQLIADHTERIEELGDVRARLAAVAPLPEGGAGPRLAEVAKRRQDLNSHIEATTRLSEAWEKTRRAVDGTIAEHLQTVESLLKGLSPSVAPPIGTLLAKQLELVAALKVMAVELSRTLSVPPESFGAAAEALRACLADVGAAAAKLEAENRAASEAVRERAECERAVTRLDQLEVERAKANDRLKALIVERRELKAGYVAVMNALLLLFYV